jgi:O-antigen/teichoic acid export membrane protein/thymidylate kinase
MNPKSEIEIPQVPSATLAQVAPPKGPPEAQDFVGTLTRLLEEIRVSYCLLSRSHADQNGPLYCLDVAVECRDCARLSMLLQSLRKEGYRPIQRRPLGANDCRYDFAGSADSGLHIFSLTLLHPFPKGRGIAIDTSIFARREKRGNCWVASDEDEFSYLLRKASLEHGVTEFQQARLSQLDKSLGTARAEAIATQIFGKGFRKVVAPAGSNGQGPEVPQGHRGRPKRAGGRGSHLQWVEYLYLQARCMLQRWSQPSGEYIVILGPDGAGKSTLTNKILELLGPLFDSSRIFQWRPQVIKPRVRYSPFFNPPHAKPPHGSIESIIRIIAVMIDYWVGYPTVIRPLLSRAGLLIYDRDFHDLLVDRLRYRYGGPSWLPALAAKLIPHPETVFLTLDADTDIILKRKQEVAPEELHRQRVAYVELAAKLPDSTLIRTDQNFESSTQEVMGAILDHLTRRFESRERKKLPSAGHQTDRDRIESNGALPVVHQGSLSSMAGKSLSALWTDWRGWFAKGFMAVTDQGFISGSNFVLSIILARVLSASQYGTYAIAYSTFVLFSLIHQALVLEPMTVLGSSLYRKSIRQYLSLLTWMQLAFSVVIVVCLGLIGIAGPHPVEPNGLALAFIGMGAASPFVLLFWYARRAYYLHLLPGRAVVGAVAYSALLVAGIGILYYREILSPFSTFLVMGASALLTSILLLIRLRSIMVAPTTSVKVTLGHVSIQHWRYGCWALVSMVFFWVPWNIFYSVVTRFSGLEGTGTLKALLNLALPITAACSAFSMLFLPHTARLGAEGGWKAAKVQSWKIASLFVLGSSAYWLVVCLFRTQLIHFLYKGQYADVAPLVPVVAISSILSGAAMGPTITIKAMRSPATVSGVYFGSTIVSLLVGIPACWAWGYRGAILAILLSSFTTCVAGFLRCSDPKGIPSARAGSAEHNASPPFGRIAQADEPQELS